jgi:hypothetical protein
MGLYHCFWRVHHTAWPTTGEGQARWRELLDWVREQMKTGFVKDWGAFTGELGGYSVVEGTEFDLVSMAERFINVCSFETRPIASAETVSEMISRALTQPVDRPTDTWVA